MGTRDDAAVRARAHQLWVESGYADGYQDQHWRQAEREVAERGTADGADAPAEPRVEATPDERVPNRAAHSDGMSLHPSVLDPGPNRTRG